MDTALLIFSKDRPLQLDLALRTLFSQCQEAEALSLTVLYQASDDRYLAAYRILGAEYPRVRFERESRFRRQTLAHLTRARFVSFLVDDNFFFAPFSLRRIESALDADRDLLGFSLRLGRNTTYHYPGDRGQALPRFEKLADDLLAFRWRGADGDFGYPLEVSGSIYRARDLRWLLRSSWFQAPNAMETALARRAFLMRKPRLACHAVSVVVALPWNKVQTRYDNRAGGDPARQAEPLLAAFERGDRLDPDAIRNYQPKSCHEELFVPLRRTRVA